MDEGMDLSGAIEKVQQMLSAPDGQNQLQSILNGFLSGAGDNAPEDTYENHELPASTGSSSASFSPSDLDMLFKIRRVMAAMNTQSGRAQAEFLSSLKPFLKKERRAKVEQAVKLMNAAKVLKAFRDINEGGG